MKNINSAKYGINLVKRKSSYENTDIFIKEIVQLYSLTDNDKKIFISTNFIDSLYKRGLVDENHVTKQIEINEDQKNEVDDINAFILNNLHTHVHVSLSIEEAQKIKMLLMDAQEEIASIISEEEGIYISISASLENLQKLALSFDQINGFTFKYGRTTLNTIYDNLNKLDNKFINCHKLSFVIAEMLIQ